jgi:hypothetical protein
MTTTILHTLWKKLHLAAPILASYRAVVAVWTTYVNIKKPFFPTVYLCFVWFLQ